MPRTASLALAAGIALVAGYAVFASWDWQWKARLFPLAIGIPLLCLAAVEVVCSFLDKRPAEGARPSAGPWLWMLLFLVLIVLLGFPIAVALFVFAYLKLQSRESWLVSIVYTALLWGAFYGLFDEMLHLPFPAGWLLEWLGLG